MKCLNKTFKIKGCIASQSASGLKRSTLASLLKKMRQTCKRNNTKYKKHHKCNVLFHLEKGSLSKFGYSMKKSKSERHRSLKKAIQKVKPLSIYRKLNALYVLNKNKHPENAKIFKNDAEWLKTITN
uniref:Uncharacterized protein n=1 Tax=viral metagenome TaxID=1070528 RepID=A0A6C0D1W0_9ZZZZ